MHCMVNGNKRMAGYVDFVCADQISTIEILSMAKDLKIDVQNCRIWWFDASTGNGSFKEIVTDGDALTMAMSVDCIKKHHVRIDLVDKGGIPSADCEDVTDAGGATYSGDEDDEDTDEEDLEELLTGSATNKKKSGEEVEIEDSDYTFNESSDDEVLGKKCMARAIVTVSGEQPELGSEYASVSEYATSDDLNSCSSTDSEEVIPRKPKYSEFNEQTDMRNPNLKIGMKFKDFKQFKEAGNMDSSEPSNNQHKQQVGNVYANIQGNMDSSEPSNNQHNQQVGNVYANIQGHQQQMKQPEHEEIPQQPMPQVIYTPGNTIPNCRNLLRRTKLGIRRGANYNKSQGAVQNTTEHTSTHLNKPGGKGQKYDDKTKEGDAGKRRRVWLPPGI